MLSDLSRLIRKVATGQKDRNTLKPSTAIFFIFIDLRLSNRFLSIQLKQQRGRNVISIDNKASC